MVNRSQPPPPAKPLVVIGAGGHAKVVIELLRFEGWNVVACTDADPTPRLVLGVPVVGDDDQLERLRSTGVEAAFVALGANAVRQRVGLQLLDIGFALPSATRLAAFVSPTARIGRGVAIMAGAVVNAAADIGDFSILNTQAGVDHDGRIGVAAHIGPGCSLAGCVGIGARTFLGVGCSVIPHILIGDDVVVGAGSVVVRNLPNGVKAYGRPARIAVLV